MPRNGPILLIDEDDDDQHILQKCLEELGVRNAVRAFNTCTDALHYLQETNEKPFLIFCDVHFSGMDGTALRKAINADERLRRKSIPFVFLANSADKESVEQSYQLMVQGFFEKPDALPMVKERLRLILEYWTVCLHPNQDLV